MVLMVRNMPNADADDDSRGGKNDDDARGGHGGGGGGDGSEEGRRPTMERRQSSVSSAETTATTKGRTTTRGGSGTADDGKVAAVGLGGGAPPGLPRSPPRLSRVAVGALPPQAHRKQAYQHDEEKKKSGGGGGGISSGGGPYPNYQRRRRRSSHSSGLSSSTGTNADRASSPSSADDSASEHEDDDDDERDRRGGGGPGGGGGSSSLLLERSFRAYIDSLPPVLQPPPSSADGDGGGNHGRVLPRTASGSSSASTSSSFSSAASSLSASSLASSAASSRSSLASSVASSAVLSDASSSLMTAPRRGGNNRDGSGDGSGRPTQRKYKHSVSKDLHNGLLLGRRWTENRRVDGDRGSGRGGGGRGRGREGDTGTAGAGTTAGRTDSTTTTAPHHLSTTRGLVDPSSLSAKALYFAGRPDATSELGNVAPPGTTSGGNPTTSHPSGGLGGRSQPPPPPVIASAAPQAWGNDCNDDDLDALLPRQLRRRQEQHQLRRETGTSDGGSKRGRLYQNLHRQHHSFPSPVLAVCSLQSSVRCHLTRSRFLLVKRSILAVQSMFRMRRHRLPYLTLRGLARRTVALAPPLTRVQSSVLTIQSACRMSPDRRKYEKIRRGAETLQQTIRGRYVRKMFMMYIHYTKAAVRIQRRWRIHQNRMEVHDAASVLQSVYRGRRNRFAFLCLVVDLLPPAQAAIRGYVTRNIMRKFRRRRIVQYRHQIFALWRRCNTPLVYRSQFWTYIMHDDGGDGFLILGVYEEELTRLWDELGVLLPSFQLQHQHQASSEEGEGGDGRGRRWGGGATAGGGSSRAVYVREGLVKIPNTPVSRIFQSVQIRLDAERIGRSGRASARARRARRGGPIFPAEVDAAEAGTAASASADDDTADGKRKHHLQEAEEELVKERMELYRRLGKKSYATLKEESRILFRIKEGEKEKKRKIIGLLWRNPELAHRSARIVLCLHREGSSCPGGVVGGINIRSLRSKARPKDWWRSSMFRFPTSTSSVAVATEAEWAQRKVEARIHRHLVELADHDPPVLPSSSSPRRRHRQKKKRQRGLHRQDHKYQRSILRRSHYDRGVRRVDSEAFASQREAITSGMYPADWPEHRFIIIRRYLTYGRWYSKRELFSQ